MHDHNTLHHLGLITRQITTENLLEIRIIITNMRTTNILLTTLLIVNVACQKAATSDENAESKAAESLVVYEYVYPGNTSDLIENHYIKLKYKGDTVAGKYYGTSDDFDDAREGYLPGFFVANMDELQIMGDSIRFLLRCSDEDVFTKAVELNIDNASEARSQGLTKWDIGLRRNEQNYVGYMRGDTIILKDVFGDRLFTKIKGK